MFRTILSRTSILRENIAPEPNLRAVLKGGPVNQSASVKTGNWVLTTKWISGAVIGAGILTWAALSVQLAWSATPQTWTGTISKVTDGDTVHFTPNAVGIVGQASEKLKIRLLSIDAPELHMPTTDQGMVGQLPWGQNSYELLNKLIPVGTPVTLVDWGKDRYGRTLGRLYLNGEEVNLKMVRAGAAIPYIICEGTTCTSTYEKTMDVREYSNACMDARKRGLGVFNRQNPLREMPFEFRLRVGHRQADKFVGDINTGLYYAPTDYNQVDVCNRIFFMKESDAMRIGYKRSPTSFRR